MLGRLRRQKRTRRQILVDRASRPAAILGDLDQAVLRFLRTRGHDPATESLMKALGLSGEYGAIWMGIGTAAALADGRRRGRWLAAAGVAPAAIVLNFAVKRTIGRQRPVITEHPPLARAPSKLSFPSAHATSSFAAAAALGRVEPRAKAPLHGLATAISVGRPYLGMHYPSDVVAGALLGAVLGRMVPGLDEKEASIGSSHAAHPTPSDRGSESASPEQGEANPAPSDRGSASVPRTGDAANPPGSDRGSERASLPDSSPASESRGTGRNIDS
jgi:membrane-associated phospholipid phosphatase